MDRPEQDLTVDRVGGSDGTTSPLFPLMFIIGNTE